MEYVVWNLVGMNWNFAVYEQCDCCGDQRNGIYYYYFINLMSYFLKYFKTLLLQSLDIVLRSVLVYELKYHTF